MRVPAGKLLSRGLDHLPFPTALSRSAATAPGFNMNAAHYMGINRAGRYSIIPSIEWTHGSPGAFEEKVRQRSHHCSVERLP
jgi:hypothetical protein